LAKLIELFYTPTDESVADILTKYLFGWKFQYLLRRCVEVCDNGVTNDNYDLLGKES
jgi:hypothetical protein